MNNAMNIAMNLDGGIHEIPLPTLGGRLWLCGKHFIGPDPERALTSVNADHVVCLVYERELRDRYDGYISWLQLTDCATWYPIHDLSSPPLAEILPIYQGVVDRLSRGETVVVHCAAGIGRAGTLAVAVCQLTGMPLNEALAHVRKHRPGAGPEVGSQLDAVIALEESLRR
ncbi:MAG: dual specificity protein phosphatase family protein [Actinomycetes bacterium]